MYSLKRFSGVLTFAALLIWTGVAVAADRIDWKYQYIKSVKKAKTEDKLMLAFFHSPVCGSCKKLKSTSLVDKDVIAFCNDNFVNNKVDFDRQSHIAKKLEVNSLPTLVFVDGKGREFVRLTAPHNLPTPVLLYRLKEIAKGYGQYMKGLKNKSNQPLYQLGLATRAYLQGLSQGYQGNSKKAKELIRQGRQKLMVAMDILGDKQTKTSVQCRYLAAKMSTRLKDHGAVVKYGEKVISLDGDNQHGYTDETMVTASVSYFFLYRKDRQRKKINRAYKLAATVVKKFPKSAYAGQAYHFWGLYALYGGQKKIAAKIWKQGIKLHPDDQWSQRSKSYLRRIIKKKKK